MDEYLLCSTIAMAAILSSFGRFCVMLQIRHVLGEAGATHIVILSGRPTKPLEEMQSVGDIIRAETLTANSLCSAQLSFYVEPPAASTIS